MFNARRYASIIASLEGLVWLLTGWSISFSVWMGRSEPVFTMVLILATLTFISGYHRPTRLLLARYHVRKRRTDMWIHLLALPLLMGMALYISIELIIGSAWLPSKMLVVNILATAGWLTFLIKLFLKHALHSLKRARGSQDAH